MKNSNIKFFSASFFIAFFFLNTLWCQKDGIENYSLSLNRFASLVGHETAPIHFIVFHKDLTTDTTNIQRLSVFKCINPFNSSHISLEKIEVVNYKKQYSIDKFLYSNKTVGPIKPIIPFNYSTFYIQIDISRIEYDSVFLAKNLNLISVQLKDSLGFKLFTLAGPNKNNEEICWKLNQAILYFSHAKLKQPEIALDFRQKGGLELSGQFGGMFGEYKINGNSKESSPVFNSNLSLMYRLPLGRGRVNSSFGMSLTHSQNQIKIEHETYSYLFSPANSAVPVNQISISSSVPIVESIQWTTLGLSLPVQLEVFLGQQSAGLSWILNGSIGYNFFMPAEAHLTQGRFNYRGIVNSIADPLINIPEWNLEDNVDVNRFATDRFYLEGMKYDFSTGIRYAKNGFFSEIRFGFVANNFALNNQNSSPALTLQPGHYSTSLRNGERISGTFFSTAISIGHQFH